MQVRAAVLEEFGQPLVVQEVDLADPKAGEVLVRIEACGVCHTDLYTASGADPSGYAPCVLGHEGAGVVEAVGPDVTLVAPGDHVVTLFAPECGECVHCRSPRTNRCTAIRDQQGLEVDFLFTGPGGAVCLAEAKATRTPVPAMAGGVIRLAGSFGKRRGRGSPPNLYVVHRPSRSGPASAAIAPGVRALPWPAFVREVLSYGGPSGMKAKRPLVNP